MLCQFSFKNFKSYKNETVFDFQAAALPEFKESVIKREMCSDILPVGVIYGPNGGGKSNLLQALSCLISTVVRPIHDLEKNRIPIIMQQKVSCAPFSFDKVSPTEPTAFEIFFRTKGYEYRYCIELFKDEIKSESLARKKIGAKKPAYIYGREEGNITLGASIASLGLNTDVNIKMPYLSFLAINYSIPIITDVQEWFETCIIRNYANPKAEQQIMLGEDENFKKIILKLLNDMGIDVTDYRYDKENQQFYLQRTLQGAKYELAFVEESDGTKKLFAALPVLLLALQEGRLTIIDELDAKLHPKLLRYVINLFKNQKVNKNGAQLLFTSHDMTTMKNTVFRRDEIWFAAINENHESEIYSLYEIRREDNERVNNTASYSKQYLEGRYGADPYLQNMMSGGDWK
ncbi:MAG: AAA family ATPase [Tyzzerella sp.]|nr:AAA family ATPase [Tyzzerella sp.]